jgi:hypothetical protein
VQENHEQRNQQANLPLFKIELNTTQMTCESLKRGSEKLLPLFPLSNAKVSKNKYAVEKEKRKWWIWGREKKFKCKWWKRKWDNYQCTS